VSTATQKLITAEEFMAMPDPPDGSQQELVRGVIVTMPPPKGLHGVCCSNVNHLVSAFVKANRLGWVTASDAGVILERGPDTVRGPDVAFYSKERCPQIPEGYFEVPPDLAVEVLSPGDSYPRVLRKVNHYLECGVRVVWVVDPVARAVAVHLPGEVPRTLEESDTLTGNSALPNFSCRAADLFP
jgi:Uma2 family endonuclease